MPLHVTLRMAPHVYNLRSRRSFRVIAASLRVGCDRFDVRVIEFSVQGNHIHLLVEAPNRRALARAIQGLSIRVAKGLNRMMGRTGRVFDDRYHARVLRTPTEVRHAIHYVLENARKHAAQRGETYAPGYVDPYSSAGAGAPDLALPRRGTDDAKQIYKQRAATAETVNADAKTHRGMAATALRALDKVTGSACLFALTYNILRFIIVSA
jgi:REP element-mobilizing transposase RayT